MVYELCPLTTSSSSINNETGHVRRGILRRVRPDILVFRCNADSIWDVAFVLGDIGRESIMTGQKSNRSPIFGDLALTREDQKRKGRPTMNNRSGSSSTTILLLDCERKLRKRDFVCSRLYQWIELNSIGTPGRKATTTMTGGGGGGVATIVVMGECARLTAEFGNSYFVYEYGFPNSLNGCIVRRENGSLMSGRTIEEMERERPILRRCFDRATPGWRSIRFE